MIGHFDGLANELAQCARSGAKVIRENYDYENENSLSMRFLDNFANEIEDYNATTPYNLDINTYKLNGMGPNTPESRFGADFVIDYVFQVSNFNLSKGIMVQAKKGSITDFEDLRDQCRSMLKWSPDSFLYKFSDESSNRRYRMFPALQISQTGKGGPKYSGRDLEFNEAYENQTTLKFYRLFFEGYVGDHWVHNNLRTLANPDKHKLTDRPMVPDGGTPQDEDEQAKGIDALVITVSEPGEEVELPFDEEDTINNFKEYRSNSYLDF